MFMDYDRRTSRTLGKIACSKCYSMATWCDFPGGGKELCSEDFFCDSCVPRGCECQVVLKEEFEPIFDEHGDIINDTENDYIHLKDENGNFLPCSEYEYSRIGFTTSDWII